MRSLYALKNMTDDAIQRPTEITVRQVDDRLGGEMTVCVVEQREDGNVVVKIAGGVEVEKL